MDCGEALLASGQPEVLAKEIDPQFTHALGGQEREVAAEWLRRILRMWTTPIVPVMRATVGTPEDILELFARLNRSGIPVRDADIYFAAVKTFWNDAEPRLKRVVDASKRGVGAGDGHAFLTMERALRLISRLAGRGLRGGDVLPLTVERIAGNRRDAMVAAMDALTSNDSPVLAAPRPVLRGASDQVAASSTACGTSATNCGTRSSAGRSPAGAGTTPTCKRSTRTSSAGRSSGTPRSSAPASARPRSWRRSPPASATSPSRYGRSCSRPGRSTRP